MHLRGIDNLIQHTCGGKSILSNDPALRIFLSKGTEVLSRETT